MTTSALPVSPHEKGRGNTVGKSNENNDLQPETQGNLSESKGVLQKSLGSEERQWAVTAHPYLRKFHFISLLFISLCFFPLKKSRMSSLPPYSPSSSSSAPIYLAPNTFFLVTSFKQTWLEEFGRGDFPQTRRWPESPCHFLGKIA